MISYYDKLVQNIEKKDILINEPMSKHTSFKVGGNADYFIFVRNISDLKYVLKVSKEYNIETFIIGNGTNILVKDKGFRGAIIKLLMDKITFDDNKIIAEAGASLILLSNKVSKSGFTGFEGLSGIPGSVGGAVRMNAGAFGNEIKDVLIETRYLDENLEEHTINNKEHNFEYRKSIFSTNKYIILESSFKLEKGDIDQIENKIKENYTKRTTSQPLDKPSAGSTFKRGEDFITAKLIDDAGLKGYRIGGAEISTKHAGLIINNNNATADDIIKLIKYTKDIIKEKFGKVIQTEIIIIGE